MTRKAKSAKSTRPARAAVRAPSATVPSTLLIGLALDPGAAYNRAIIQGAIHAARREGVYLVRLSSGRMQDMAGAAKDYHGMVGMFTHAKMAEDVELAGLPAINVSTSDLSVGLPRVATDDFAVGRMAAEHFLDRNYVHLAYVGISPRGFSERRQRGFVARLAEAGRTCHLPDSAAWKRGRTSNLVEATEAILGSLGRWLARLPRPLGVLACNDIRARHVVDAALRAGLAVPEEVAVLGVDNDPLECDLSGLPLSSVELAGEKIGAAATVALIRQIRQGVVPPRETLIPPLRVITRRSTEVMATSDAAVSQAVREIQTAIARGVRPSVDQMASAVAVSRRSLERRFRLALGRSVRREIERTAIVRASQLLIETSQPIKSVAHAAGFTDVRRFGEAFLRVMKSTASEYRRVNQPLWT